MLIEFTKKSNIYDDFKTLLYDENYNNHIIYNFTPVKILNEYYILTSLANLEGYLLEYRNNIIIKLYLEDNVEIININSVISFTEENYNPKENYDCYIDTICNLLLIKYKSNNINYIEISNNFNIKNDIKNNYELKLIKYSWTNSQLKKKNYEKISKLKFIWENKYINLPSIPYIIDILSINNKLFPITGSSVYSSNNLIGMVSFIQNNEIIITPLICIKMLSKYLEEKNILTLGLDLFPVNFNFKSKLNDIEFKNGLIISNDLYSKIKNNIIKNKINKIDLTKNIKYLVKKNIICSIDNYKFNSIGYLEISKSKFIPFKSYIWLFKSEIDNIIKINIIPNYIYNINLIELNYNKNIIDDRYIKKKIKIIETSIILNNYNEISSINTVDIKYLKYKKFIICELNEKILCIFKSFIRKNSYLYEKVFENIFSFKFNNLKKKLIISINFDENIPLLNLILEYDNFDSIIEKYKTKKEQKEFINSIKCK